MGVKLIFSIKMLYILLETTSSQYNYQNNMQNSMYQNQYQSDYFPQEYDEIEKEDDYDHEPHVHYRRSRHSKRKPYGSSGGKLPMVNYDYDESEECRCSCIRCDDPDPCCKDICNNCNVQDNPQVGQANLVFIPYPYPLIVTPKVIDRHQKQSSAETSTTPPSTTATTQQQSTKTTTEIITSLEDFSQPLETKRLFNGNNEYSELRSELKPKYILTPLRRTKPVWLPKYGIVSIPNKLAEKLMSKLRDVKELQNRKT